MFDVKKLEQYCSDKRGAYRDCPFGEIPICYKLNGKIFAQIYPDKNDCKITLKCTKEDGEFFRSLYPDAVVRGYHCPPSQQPYWNTVYIEKIPDYELFKMIDLAYKRVFYEFSQKVRRELRKKFYSESKSKFTEIKTKRLTLKPIGTEYFETVFNYSTDTENTKYMFFLPYESKEEVMDFLRNAENEWEKELPEYYEFAVILNNVQIGAVSVYFDKMFECGELAWIIDKRYWGNGYAYEASKAVIEVFVKYLSVFEYVSHCDSDNKPSIRVMEKLGMNLSEMYGGRKNRCSDEIKQECKYELYL